MEIARGKESIPDPNKFDLITHHWNRQGQLTRTNLYILYVIEGNKYFERPVNSGNLWYENNQPAGRMEKSFNDDGVVSKKVFKLGAPHKDYTPVLKGDDALRYQIEQERARATAAESELAAIKAEQSKKSGKQAQAVSQENAAKNADLAKLLG